MEAVFVNITQSYLIMRSTYTLFQSHIDLAHHYWSQLIKPGDHAIDATCGNGHDTLKLCQLALCQHEGKIYAFDRQREAIKNTESYLNQNLLPNQVEHVQFILGCHSQFPSSIIPNSIKLIVYNLGYLPGGDKTQTTETSTTLLSLQKALAIVKPGGAISVTCYPGHPEGACEEEAILKWIQTLSPLEWSACHHKWINRRQAPSLLLLQKAK